MNLYFCYLVIPFAFKIHVGIGWGDDMLPTYHQVISLNVWRPIFGIHDDVIKRKHFPRNWPFVRGIVWLTVNSPCKGQWRSALLFPYICDWRSWVNNREAGDLRRYRAHYDITVMYDIQVIVNSTNVYYLSSMLVSHLSWLICFVQILSMIKWDRHNDHHIPFGFPI